MLCFFRFSLLPQVFLLQFLVGLIGVSCLLKMIIKNKSAFRSFLLVFFSGRGKYATNYSFRRVICIR